MRLNRTYLIFDTGQRSQTSDWDETHRTIEGAVKAMAWPDKEGNSILRLPRKVTLEVRARFTSLRGEQETVKRTASTLRNGVRPLRDQFRRRMSEAGWSCEQPLELASFFQKSREIADSDITLFGLKGEVDRDAFNEAVGAFDYWICTPSGFRTVVEWETGNISSSHRSVNKMCLALMAGLTDAAVLIVPSATMYPHLTDRIGNIRELQPYFYFWSGIGKLVKTGVLAMIEVEHDELFDSSDMRDFIPAGAEGMSKKRRKPRWRKSSKKR